MYACIVLYIHIHAVKPMIRDHSKCHMVFQRGGLPSEVHLTISNTKITLKKTPLFEGQTLIRRSVTGLNTCIYIYLYIKHQILNTEKNSN